MKKLIFYSLLLITVFLMLINVVLYNDKSYLKTADYLPYLIYHKINPDIPKKTINLIKQYNLSDTNKIIIIPLQNKNKLKSSTINSIEIQKQDIPKLLKTLNNIYYKEWFYGSKGDYILEFYKINNKITFFNLRHHNILEFELGCCEVNNDFIQILIKYIPNYYNDYK